MQAECISGCENCLYFVHLLKNEVIISWMLLDGIEFELLVRRNWHSSFVKISAFLSVLVKVTGYMTKAHL